MAASSMCPPAFLSGTTHWTSLQEICAQRILTLFTRQMANRRRFTMRVAWRGGSGPRGAKPNYTGWDVVIVRDKKIAALYVFLDSMPS
jgi:hypothetical protein